jgi:DNA-binding CsgD family transcriptional regulator
MNEVTVRGRMSETELEQCADLFERGYSTGQIAGTLGRHRATVNWALQRMGLKAPLVSNRRPFVRMGRQVRPFSPEEDELLVLRRREGAAYGAISAEMEYRFGYRRAESSLLMRLMQLKNLAEVKLYGTLVKRRRYL